MASDEKKLKALADFEISYPHPITFKTGEELETHHHDDVWTGWIWVKTTDGNTGWAPESYLKRVDERKAGAIRDYTARELSMKKGDILSPSLEISGWLWCTNQRGEEGWAPAFNLRPVND